MVLEDRERQHRQYSHRENHRQVHRDVERLRTVKFHVPKWRKKTIGFS